MRSRLSTRHHLAISPPGLCTRCSLYLGHNSPFSQTLTGPSKHNSGDVSSRKPSLTGPKLAQVPPRIPGFQAPQGPSRLPPKAPRLSGLVVSPYNKRSPKPVPVSPLHPRWPSAHCHSRPQALGRYTNPAQRGACLPENFTRSTWTSSSSPPPRQ